VPSLNGSILLEEIFTRRAHTAGGNGDFPWFALGGGATVSATVTRIGADSALLDVANQEQRLAVDAVGRIMGGSIVGGIRIVRLGPDAAKDLTLAPPPDVPVVRPDYSAPAGAPYTAEEVVLTGPKGIRLGGTLTKPKGAGPFPAAITITGSGQQDRDEFIPLAGGVRLFRQVADTLSRRGVAVLRLDDRGVGASGGDPTTSTTADFADDIRAAVAYLRTRRDIDAGRIALIGHSEGGIIGPMVAASDPQIHALVIMAGPASKGIDISKAQNRAIIDRNTSYSAAKKDSVYAGVVAQLEATVPSNPWIKFFWAYDPAPTARKVKAPTLILQGATDHQVVPAEGERLAALMKEGGNTRVTLRLLPNVNHLFLDDPDGDFINYDKLKSNQVSPATLGALADWVATAMMAPKPRP
jgi:dipeptidyl aminopeptidase/acylaminoacyl peptidase